MRFQFVATALVLVMAGSAASAQSLRLANDQPYSEGPFAAHASGWCNHFDKNLNFRNGMLGARGGLPRSNFSWQFPNQKSDNPKCGVFGYNYVAWGNYAGDPTRSPVAPKQVAAIQTLSVDYGVSIGGNPDGMNGLLEFYLTRAPGVPESRAIEIGNFWHTPPSTAQDMQHNIPVGTFSDRYGQNWTVVQVHAGNAGNFVKFFPAGGADLLTGSVDLKGEIDFLRDKGLVQDDWWFNGVALGAEPKLGAGSFSIQSFNVSYH